MDMEGRKYSLFGQCVTLVHDPAGQFIQPEKRKTMSCAVLSLCLDCRYSEKLNLEGESTIAFRQLACTFLAFTKSSQGLSRSIFETDRG